MESQFIHNTRVQYHRLRILQERLHLRPFKAQEPHNLAKYSSEDLIEVSFLNLCKRSKYYQILLIN
jgi:hypothetical protein